MTPLNLSLERVGKPEFSEEISIILLRAGADPNTIDNRDRSCLARAVGGGAVCGILLEYGAIITHSALKSAIKSEDLDILQFMLCRDGVDPNRRKPGKEVPSWMSANGRSFSPEKHGPDGPDELYPIDYVICEIGRICNFAIGLHMFDLLLKHGADLNAKYERTTVVHRMVNNMGTSMNEMHDEDNPFLFHILEHPSLELESRDADGLTILHLACQLGKIKVIKTLPNKGADVRARDNRSQNVLNIFLRSRGAFKPITDDSVADNLVLRKEFIQHLVLLAPEMFTEVDADGRTPLHCSLQNDSFVGDNIEALLLAGVDVMLPSQKRKILHFTYF